MAPSHRPVQLLRTGVQLVALIPPRGAGSGQRRAGQGGRADRPDPAQARTDRGARGAPRRDDRGDGGARWPPACLLRVRGTMTSQQSTWTGMMPVDDTALYVRDAGGPGRPMVYLNGAPMPTSRTGGASSLTSAATTGTSPTTARPRQVEALGGLFVRGRRPGPGHRHQPISECRTAGSCPPTIAARHEICRRT